MQQDVGHLLPDQGQRQEVFAVRSVLVPPPDPVVAAAAGTGSRHFDLSLMFMCAGQGRCSAWFWFWFWFWTRLRQVSTQMPSAQPSLAAVDRSSQPSGWSVPPEPGCWHWSQPRDQRLSVLDGEVGWLSCPLFSDLSILNNSSYHNLSWSRLSEGGVQEQPLTFR